MSGDHLPPLPPTPEYQMLLTEIEERKFNVIRFPTYRAACKLRYLQKRTNIQLVDIWNAIEAIRENGLHVFQDLSASLPFNRLKTLVTSIFYQLSKRLPPSQKLNLEISTSQLLSYLMSTFDPAGLGSVSVFSIKIALATLSSGKVEDKLAYMFSLMSDHTHGTLIESKFKFFVQQLLVLARSICESDPYFNYDDGLPSRIFPFSDGYSSVKLKDFVECVMSPKSPPVCFSFFMAFARMPEVEQVMHPISCEGCHRQGFYGFRYKCQKCFNFNLCQDCFWRGRSSGSHDPDSHPCKEYSYWQSQSAQLTHSLRRSFRCLPSHRAKIQVKEEVVNPKRIDLKHIVPPSPIPKHHNFTLSNRIAPSKPEPFPRNSPAYGSMPNMNNSFFNNPLINSIANGDDEEHRLVALYAHKLQSATCTPTVERKGFGSQNTIEKQQLIAQLEARNREMSRQIELLKNGDFALDDVQRPKISPSVAMEPLYATELTALRMRKDELEKHLNRLLDSRKGLLVQLENLMTLLKTQGNLPASTPASAASTMSRSQIRSSFRNQSREKSPQATAAAPTADSVRDAVYNLVRQLNSEDEETMEELGLDLSRKLRTKHLKPRSNNLKDSRKPSASSRVDDEQLSIASLAQEILNLKNNPSTEAHKKFDDDTDIYPETDDEFYCVAWRK